MSGPNPSAQTDGLGDAIADGVGKDLEQNSRLAAASAEARGSFEADLVVLHGYYTRLTHLYEQVGAHLTSKSNDAAAVADLASTSTAGVGAVGMHGAQITGVNAAITAIDRARSGEDSVHGALRAVQAALARHLTNLADCYDGYIKADQDGARRLTAVDDPGASRRNGPDKQKSYGL